MKNSKTENQNLPVKGKAKTKPMAGTTPEAGVTEEEIAKYENSPEAAAADASYRTEQEAQENTPAGKLERSFQQSGPMIEHQAFIAGVLARLADDAVSRLIPVTIKLPKALLDLLIWDETKNAEADGRRPEEAGSIISREVENGLQQRLHWLTVEPTVYRRYKNLWNDFCVAHGAPELKIVEPSADEKGTADEGPF